MQLQREAPDYKAWLIDLVTLLAATVALITFTRFSFYHREPRSIHTCSVGALLGLVFFIQTLGWSLVDPTQIDWLLQGDWAQHFVGWHLYRNTPWEWPLGYFDTFWYPVGTSVVYTDSLPIFALPLKLLSPVLSTRFQYIGIELLTNFTLHGIFAALLMRCFTRNLSLQAIGIGLLLLCPVLISRIGHDTLTAQWLILAGFWIYFRPPNINTSRTSLPWLVLSGVAALIHPYLSLITLAIASAFYLRLTFAEHVLTLPTAIRQILVLIFLTLACWWLSGALILRGDHAGVPFGFYNANLLTWLDSQQHSRWLPELSHAGDGQYEGFGYLGLGVLLLAIIALIEKGFRRSKSCCSTVHLWPLLLAVGVLTLLALSTRLTLGNLVLFDLTPKRLPLLEAFRSSGRFIWPSCYLISVLSMAVVIQRGKPFALPLLGAALIIQLLDLAPSHLYTALLRTGKITVPVESTLHDSYWSQVITQYHHITLIPPPACGQQAAPYLPFSLLAGDYGLSINTGYLARFDAKKTAAYCTELTKEITGGIRHPDTLYVVHPDKLAEFRSTSVKPLSCREIESYTICTVAVTGR